MQSYQLTRLYNILTAPQTKLFESLNRRKQWLGELYLTLILSQEDLEYIYSSNTIEHQESPNYISDYISDSSGDYEDDSCIIIVSTPVATEPKNYPLNYQVNPENHHDFYLPKQTIRLQN